MSGGPSGGTRAVAPHLVLVGPTASGKSEIALAMAAARGADIVAADAMQVYRGMDIGTAKPSPEDRAAVAHHGLDLVDPAARFTVRQWLEHARAAIAAIEAAGRRAIVVGGTGLYVQALVDDLSPPGEYPGARAEVEAEPDTGALHARLVELDPVTAGRVVPTNRRRIVRALEVTLGSGRPFSSYGPGMTAYAPNTRFALAGLWLPRAALDQRIRSRVESMLAAGLVDEVRALTEAVPALEATTAGQALGYKELLPVLDGRAPLAAARDDIVSRTRTFANRQRRWFRRDPRVHWYGCGRNPVAVLPALLRDWS